MTHSSARVSASGRRRFLQVIGLTGLASAVNASMLSWAQTRPTAPSTIPVAPAQPDTARSSSEPPPISEDARALAGVIERRYGKHLSAKQLEAVTREIENRLQGGKRLRESQLANANEPDFVFHAE